MEGVQEIKIILKQIKSVKGIACQRVCLKGKYLKVLVGGFNKLTNKKNKLRGKEKNQL